MIIMEIKVFRVVRGPFYKSEPLEKEVFEIPVSEEVADKIRRRISEISKSEVPARLQFEFTLVDDEGRVIPSY